MRPRVEPLPPVLCTILRVLPFSCTITQGGGVGAGIENFLDPSTLLVVVEELVSGPCDHVLDERTEVILPLVV